MSALGDPSTASPKLNKFEHVRGSCVQDLGGPCMASSNASWVMVIWGPPPPRTDRQDRRRHLAVTSLAGGNKYTRRNSLAVSYVW